MKLTSWYIKSYRNFENIPKVLDTTKGLSKDKGANIRSFRHTLDPFYALDPFYTWRMYLHNAPLPFNLFDYLEVTAKRDVTFLQNSLWTFFSSCGVGKHWHWKI